MQTNRNHTSRTPASRLAAAAAAAFVSIGLLYGVASGFHESKAVQIAKAEGSRVLAVAGQK